MLGFYRVRTELVYRRTAKSTAISFVLGTLYSKLLVSPWLRRSDIDARLWPADVRRNIPLYALIPGEDRGKGLRNVSSRDPLNLISRQPPSILI